MKMLYESYPLKIRGKPFSEAKRESQSIGRNPETVILVFYSKQLRGNWLKHPNFKSINSLDSAGLTLRDGQARGGNLEVNHAPAAVSIGKYQKTAFNFRQ